MDKIQTGDQNLVKQINKSIVLHSIENNGTTSRAQISKDTGLNKATVSTMVSELIKENFVNEIGIGQSSGGRKPVLLKFNKHAGYSIGIDLGVNYILAVLTDLKGSILIEISEAFNVIEIDEITARINSIITRLIDRAPKSPYGIVGIGIGIPGLVDKDGTILFTPHLDFQHINFKQMIEKKFNITTIVVNEANSGAHGEQVYGTGKNVSNLVYVSIGIGIGTGIIINGKLYIGSTGISGEMGHQTIDSFGKKCRCGNHGCWELYASESTLLQEAKKLEVFKDFSIIDLDMIESEAKQGNTEVIELLHMLGEYIAIGLTTIINTFNPEIIILGNHIARFEAWITNIIYQTLDNRLSTFHRESVDIKFASLGIYSSTLGSSAFSISNFLNHNRVTVT